MARTPEQIVQAEVLCCMSSIVATLASGYGAAIVHVDAYGRRSTNGSDLSNLIEQAFELAAPIEDWESAAREAGAKITRIDVEESPNFGKWVVLDQPVDTDMYVTFYEDTRHASIAYCDYYDIEPHQTEVFEHWAVTDWFADQLVAHGEKVDKDFAGLCIWARTTTGQAIASDYVLEQIAADLNRA